MKRINKSLKCIGAAFISAMLLSGCVTSKVSPKPEENLDQSVEQTSPETETAVTSPKKTSFDKKGFLKDVKKLSKDGRYEEALSMIDKVPSDFRDDVDIGLLKVKLLDVKGDYSQGYEVCSKLYKNNPDNSEVKTLLDSLERKIFMGELEQLLDDKDFDNAIALFDTLSEDNSKTYDIMYLKASVLASAGKYKESKALCDELMKSDPNNVDTLSLAATIARMTGDKKAKNDYLKQVIKKDPNNVDANVALAENSMTNKNYAQAQSYYAKALKKESENKDVMLGMAITQYFLEQDDECKKTLDKIVALDPSYDQSYYYLAKLADANNESKLAVDEIEKAIKINDSNYDYYLDYGLYLRSLGKFSEAEKAWTKAISLNPDYFLAYAYRAGLYDEQDMFQKAIADYKTVVTLNPAYYYSYESLGVLALREKDYKTARESFMKCYESNTSNISYPLMVTYCYYKEGNELEAKKYSENVYRKMNNSTLEYKMLRAYHDLAGYQNIPQEITKLTNQNQRGKLYFYMGLLYTIVGGGEEVANEYFIKVAEMNTAMFFEYRIAQWNVGIVNGK